MNNKISIVIPCYNSTFTLEESLASIYTQNLTTPFEVILVDDGSTDNTLECIIKLSQKFPHVTYYSHSSNRGGGAARNTGIKKSTGNLIYCLDSDNFFAPNILQKMINFLDEKNADGVAFSERRYFANKNIRDYNSQFYRVSDYPVSIDEMFSNNPPVLDNFLFTKKSFYQTCGYPENHGFDTQCFELRYLSAGLKVFFCPDTYFYHRQAGYNKSYFERVYESGDFSINYYLIYEDILYLFSPLIRHKIIQFDIFKNSAIGDIDGMMRESHDISGNLFFIDEFESYLKPNGFEIFVNKHLNSSETTDIFCLAVYYFKSCNYEQALQLFTKLLDLGINSKIIFYNILRTLTAIGFKKNHFDIERSTSELINSLHAKRQKEIFPNLLSRIMSKLFSDIN